MSTLRRIHHEDHNEFEHDLLSRAFYHRRYVHYRATTALVGLTLVAVGLVTMSLQHPIMFALAVIMELITVGYGTVPCSCGKMPTITAKLRTRLARLKSKRYIVVVMVAAFCIGLTVNSLVFAGLATLATTFDKHAVLTLLLGLLQITGMFAITVGSVAVVSSAIDRVDWIFANKIIPEREVTKISQLQGHTCVELNMMINFHLKAGNYSTADALSRELMHAVETETAS